MELDKPNYEEFMETEFPKLSSCKIIDIEITPSGDGRIDLFIRCSALEWRKPMATAGTFQVIEALLESGFIILASGKEKLNRDERFEEMYGGLNTWFILSKA